MRNLKTKVALAMFAALASTYSFGQAAGTGSITVSATVQGVCRFTSTPNMTFAAIDPSTTGDKTATSTIKWRCTKGLTGWTNFSVNGDNTSPYNSVLTGALASPDTMAYKIEWGAVPALAGAGFGGTAAEASLVLTGTIADTAYSVVKADTYTESVPISIAP
jgi:spore coat protein U-like protein